MGTSEAAAQEAAGEAEAEAEAEVEVEVEVKVEAGDSVNGAQTGDLMVLVWLKMAKRKMRMDLDRMPQMEKTKCSKM